MESVRQNKVARLLQKELGEIFQRESKNLFGGIFITVTQVRVSPDLRETKIYLSLFLAKDKNAVLKLIVEKTPEIRKRLGDKVKNQLRTVPNLTFFIDDSLDYAMKIEELLKK